MAALGGPFSGGPGGSARGGGFQGRVAGCATSDARRRRTGPGGHACAGTPSALYGFAYTCRTRHRPHPVEATSSRRRDRGRPGSATPREGDQGGCRLEDVGHARVPQHGLGAFPEVPREAAGQRRPLTGQTIESRGTSHPLDTPVDHERREILPQGCRVGMDDVRRGNVGRTAVAQGMLAPRGRLPTLLAQWRDNAGAGSRSPLHVRAPPPARGPSARPRRGAPLRSWPGVRRAKTAGNRSRPGVELAERHYQVLQFGGPTSSFPPSQ